MSGSTTDVTIRSGRTAAATHLNPLEEPGQRHTLTG